MALETNSPVPIVIVGAGVIGKKHAEAISDFPIAKLAAVVDPTPAGRMLAEEFQSKHFESIESLLSSPTRVEGAIICTPNETHVPIGKQLASAGIHLLVEKPLSPNALDGASLIAHCAQNKVKVCVGHHRRQNPRIIAAKETLDRSAVGQVVGISGVWATLKTADYFEGVGIWRREATGGVVLINVIHEIDLLQFLIGRISRVYAEKAPSTRGYTAEEGIALTLRFDNGAIGTFLALDNASSPYTFEQATGEFTYHPYTGQDCYRIFGRQGTLNVPKNELWTPKNLEEGWKSRLKTETIPHSDGEAFTRQLQNFIEVVKGESSPSCAGEDGLAAVAVCEAIHMSLSEGRPINIPQPSDLQNTL